MKRMKKALAVLLTAALLFSLTALLPTGVSAAAQPKLTVKTQSNLFPAAEAAYYDLSTMEDENGDVFVTVEFKLAAEGKYLINLDLEGLLWDPAVLEWKEEYNMFGSGRNRRLDLFPFAAENNYGAGITNSFGDNNGGKVIGNFTSVMPAAYAYNEDGSAITLVRGVFKVLDREAGETTVTCAMKSLGLCDDTIHQPYTQYRPIVSGEVNNDDIALVTCSTVITPAAQQRVVPGDFDGDGELTINDITNLQRLLCGFSDVPFDIDDPDFIALADVNGDGKVNIKDVTELQRALAGFIEL